MRHELNRLRDLVGASGGGPRHRDDGVDGFMPDDPDYVPQARHVPPGVADARQPIARIMAEISLNESPVIFHRIEYTKCLPSIFVEKMQTRCLKSPIFGLACLFDLHCDHSRRAPFPRSHSVASLSSGPVRAPGPQRRRGKCRQCGRVRSAYCTGRSHQAHGRPRLWRRGGGACPSLFPVVTF
jgi:hypothetical protein